MIVARSVSKTYGAGEGAVEVLRGVSLSLEPGEAVAIMGPSGSGKSTLLNILGTLEPPTSGSVSLAGTDPFALSAKELARFRNQRIGFVFQEHHLLPQCSVVENVLLPTLVPGGEPRSSMERAQELLERVGLSHRLEHRPGQLSGGERQRAALARALIRRPALVLADEPTGNLDRASAEAVGALLSELHRQEQVCLIVVTHSEALAERFPKRMEMADGTLRPL